MQNRPAFADSPGGLRERQGWNEGFPCGEIPYLPIMAWLALLVAPVRLARPAAGKKTHIFHGKVAAVQAIGNSREADSQAGGRLRITDGTLKSTTVTFG